MNPTLAFDIETIPDVPGLRRLYDLGDDIPDSDVANFAFQRQRQKNGSDFLPHHLHRVVAISCLLRWGEDRLHIGTLGKLGDDEASQIAEFFALIEKYSPQLVSWNGGGFDLPALHYRALVNGVSAPRYWDLGENDRDFKWNNYISRYHMRHLDLMDVLAMYQPRANAPLDDLAKLSGFPGKLGMDGSKVWEAWQNGQQQEVRDYCETDVANTWLVFLRFQKMRGHLSEQAYRQECDRFRTHLSTLPQAHWPAFLNAWPTVDNGGRSA